MPPRLLPWIPRLLLGLLLLAAGDLLLWDNPAGRGPLDWAVRGLLYLLLACLLLDLALRYRVRDLWGMMFLAGIYTLLQALLLNPAASFADMPRTFVQQALGARWLLGLEMLGLFLVLLGGGRRALRLLLMGAVAVGFNWGVWAAWYPVFNPAAYAPPPVEQMLAAALLLLALLLPLYILLRRTAPALTRGHLLLGGYALPALLLLLALLAALEWSAGSFPPEALLVPALLALCYAGIWFRKDTRLPSLPEQHLLLPALPGAALLLAAGIFASAAVLGAELPLVLLFAYDQFALIVLAFTAVGMAWLPLTAFVLALRGVSRQFQQYRA